MPRRLRHEHSAPTAPASASAERADEAAVQVVAEVPAARAAELGKEGRGMALGWACWE